MKQFKQLAALFLAFVMVIGVFSVPTVAYADEDLTPCGVKKENVTVDYINQEIRVEKTAAQQIYYTTKWVKKSAASAQWDDAIVVTSTCASIDFSFTAENKEVSIFITDDVEKEPYEVKLAAQETTLAVTFSGVAKTTDKSKAKVDKDWSEITELTACSNASTWSYGFLCVTVKDKDKKTVALTTDQVEKYLQFKKGAAGKWQSITQLDLRKYAASGTTLYFRIAATNDAATGDALKLGRASKEIKVKYSKQANAPKLTIDGTKKTVKLAKTMEYRLGTTSGSSIVYTDWISVEDNHMKDGKVQTVELKDLRVANSGSAWAYAESKSGQVIQVRTAASEKGIASKIRTVKLNEVATPTTSSSLGLTFKLVKSTSFSGGIEVTNNNTGSAMQIAVVSGSPLDLNGKEVKWITIKAKTATSKPTVIKGAALEAGDRIIYRFASVKDNTKTTANEFKVSSGINTFMYKSVLTLAKQEMSISNIAKVKAPETAVTTASAITSGQALIEVSNTATAGAMEYTVNLAGTNIAVNSTVKVECVAGMTDSAAAATSTTVKITADGKMGSTGKLKLTITDKVAAGDTFFRVTVDGYKFYVKVTFK